MSQLISIKNFDKEKDKNLIFFNNKMTDLIILANGHKENLKEQNFKIWKFQKNLTTFTT